MARRMVLTMVQAVAVAVAVAVATGAGGCRKQPAATDAEAGAASGVARADDAAPTPLGSGAVLVGSVTKLGAGGGVESPQVTILDLLSRTSFEGVRPDGAGRFSAAVAPGRYALTARLAGFDCDAVEVDALDRQAVVLVLVPQGIRPPRTVTPEAPSAAGELEVTLIGIDGKPAAGAWAWLWIEPARGARHQDQTQADRAGVARFARLPAGTITVGADHPTAGVLDGRVVERGTSGVTRARFSLTLGGSLQGHVTDAAGRPLADIPVSLSGAPVPIDAGPHFRSARTQLTDRTGAFRIHGLRRGRFTLEAGWTTAPPATRYEFGAVPNPRRLGVPPRPKALKMRGAYVLEVDAMPGQHVGGLGFVLPRADGVLAGTLVDESGRPVNGALVEVFLASVADHSHPDQRRLAAALSDQQGAFRIERMPNGRKLRLSAVKRGDAGTLAEVLVGTSDARLVVGPRDDQKPAPSRP